MDMQYKDPFEDYSRKLRRRLAEAVRLGLTRLALKRGSRDRVGRREVLEGDAWKLVSVQGWEGPPRWVHNVTKKYTTKRPFVTVVAEDVRQGWERRAMRGEDDWRKRRLGDWRLRRRKELLDRARRFVAGEEGVKEPGLEEWEEAAYRGVPSDEDEDSDGPSTPRAGADWKHVPLWIVDDEFWGCALEEPEIVVPPVMRAASLLRAEERDPGLQAAMPKTRHGVAAVVPPVSPMGDVAHVEAALNWTGGELTDRMQRIRDAEERMKERKREERERNLQDPDRLGPMAWSGVRSVLAVEGKDIAKPEPGEVLQGLAPPEQRKETWIRYLRVGEEPIFRLQYEDGTLGEAQHEHPFLYRLKQSEASYAISGTGGGRFRIPPLVDRVLQATTTSKSSSDAFNLSAAISSTGPIYRDRKRERRERHRRKLESMEETKRTADERIAAAKRLASRQVARSEETRLVEIGPGGSIDAPVALAYFTFERETDDNPYYSDPHLPDSDSSTASSVPAYADADRAADRLWGPMADGQVKVLFPEPWTDEEMDSVENAQLQTLEYAQNGAGTVHHQTITPAGTLRVFPPTSTIGKAIRKKLGVRTTKKQVPEEQEGDEKEKSLEEGKEDDSLEEDKVEDLGGAEKVEVLEGAEKVDFVEGAEKVEFLEGAEKVDFVKGADSTKTDKPPENIENPPENIHNPPERPPMETRAQKEEQDLMERRKRRDRKETIRQRRLARRRMMRQIPQQPFEAEEDRSRSKEGEHARVRALRGWGEMQETQGVVIDGVRVCVKTLAQGRMEEEGDDPFFGGARKQPENIHEVFDGVKKQTENMLGFSGGVKKQPETIVSEEVKKQPENVDEEIDRVEYERKRFLEDGVTLPVEWNRGDEVRDVWVELEEGGWVRYGRRRATIARRLRRLVCAERRHRARWRRRVSRWRLMERRRVAREMYLEEAWNSPLSTAVRSKMKKQAAEDAEMAWKRVKERRLREAVDRGVELRMRVRQEAERHAMFLEDVASTLVVEKHTKDKVRVRAEQQREMRKRFVRTVSAQDVSPRFAALQWVRAINDPALVPGVLEEHEVRDPGLNGAADILAVRSQLEPEQMERGSNTGPEWRVRGNAVVELTEVEVGKIDMVEERFRVLQRVARSCPFVMPPLQFTVAQNVDPSGRWRSGMSALTLVPATQGPSLARRLAWASRRAENARESRPGPRLLYAWVLSIARALAALHAHNMPHGRLTPAAVRLRSKLAWTGRGGGFGDEAEEADREEAAGPQTQLFLAHLPLVSATTNTNSSNGVEDSALYFSPERAAAARRDLAPYERRIMGEEAAKAHDKEQQRLADQEAGEPSFADDIWALGSIAFAAATLRGPIQHDQDIAEIARALPLRHTKLLLPLLRACNDIDQPPTARPSAASIVAYLLSCAERSIDARGDESLLNQRSNNTNASESAQASQKAARVALAFDPRLTLDERRELGRQLSFQRAANQLRLALDPVRGKRPLGLVRGPLQPSTSDIESYEDVLKRSDTLAQLRATMEREREVERENQQPLGRVDEEQEEDDRIRDQTNESPDDSDDKEEHVETIVPRHSEETKSPGITDQTLQIDQNNPSPKQSPNEKDQYSTTEQDSVSVPTRPTRPLSARPRIGSEGVGILVSGGADGGAGERLVDVRSMDKRLDEVSAGVLWRATNATAVRGKRRDPRGIGGPVLGSAHSAGLISSPYADRQGPVFDRTLDAQGRGGEGVKRVGEAASVLPRVRHLPFSPFEVRAAEQSGQLRRRAVQTGSSVRVHEWNPSSAVVIERSTRRGVRLDLGFQVDQRQRRTDPLGREHGDDHGSAASDVLPPLTRPNLTVHQDDEAVRLGLQLASALPNMARNSTLRAPRRKKPVYTPDETDHAQISELAVGKERHKHRARVEAMLKKARPALPENDLVVD